MADPILVTCVDCGKQIKAPPTAGGKKIRCPKCKTILSVPAAKVEAVTTGPDGKPRDYFEQEAVEAKNPYAVTYESTAQRCPHCAQDIDPPDSVICLNCGYDLIQRALRERKTVYERTASDFIMWHLPTLGAFIGICLIWAGYIYYHYWLPEVVLSAESSKTLYELGRWNYFDNDNADWTGVIFHWGVEVWLIVIGLFFTWRLGRFIFIRLFLHFLPPERRKRDKLGESESV